MRKWLLLLLLAIFLSNTGFIFSFAIRQLALPVLEYVLPRIVWVVPTNLIFQKYFKGTGIENVEIKAYKGIEIGNVVLFSVAVPKMSLEKEKTELKAFGRFMDPFFDFGLNNSDNERSSWAFRMNEQGLVLQEYEIFPNDVFDVFTYDINFDYNWSLQYIKYYEYDNKFIDVSGVFLIKDFYDTSIEYTYYRWTIIQDDEYSVNDFFETYTDCKRDLENFIMQNNIDEGLFVIKQYKETIYYKQDVVVGRKVYVAGIDVFGWKEGVNSRTKDLINLNDENVVVKVKELLDYDVVTVGVWKDSLRILTKEELFALDKSRNGAVIQAFHNADVINVGGVEQSVLDEIETVSWEYSEDQASQQEINEANNYLNNLKDEIVNSIGTWVEDFSDKVSRKFPFSLFSDIIYIYNLMIQFGSYDYNDLKRSMMQLDIRIPYFSSLGLEVDMAQFVDMLDILRPMFDIIKFINTMLVILIILKFYRRFFIPV